MYKAIILYGNQTVDLNLYWILLVKKKSECYRRFLFQIHAILNFLFIKKSYFPQKY